MKLTICASDDADAPTVAKLFEVGVRFRAEFADRKSGDQVLFACPRSDGSELVIAVYWTGKRGVVVRQIVDGVAV